MFHRRTCAHCRQGFKKFGGTNTRGTNCCNCGVPTHPPGPAGCSLDAGSGYSYGAVVCAACLEQVPQSTVAQDALRWRAVHDDLQASQAGHGVGGPPRESRSAAAVAADGARSALDTDVPTDVPGLEPDVTTATDTTTAVEDAPRGRHLRTCGHCHQQQATFSCYECGAHTHGPGPDGCSLQAGPGGWLAVVCAHCLSQDPLSRKAAAALECDRDMRAAKEAGPGFGGPPRAMRSATGAERVEGVPLHGVGGGPAAPPAPIPAATPAARLARSHAFCGSCGEGRCTWHCCVCGEATHSPNTVCSKWGWGGEMSGVAVCAACCTKAKATKAKDAVSWERQLQLLGRSSRSGAAGAPGRVIDASTDTATDMPGLAIGDSTAAEDRMQGVDDADHCPGDTEEELMTQDEEDWARLRGRSGQPPRPASSQGVSFFPLLLCYHLDS